MTCSSHYKEIRLWHFGTWGGHLPPSRREGSGMLFVMCWGREEVGDVLTRCFPIKQFVSMEVPVGGDAALVPQVPPKVRLCCFLGSSCSAVAQTLPTERDSLETHTASEGCLHLNGFAAPQPGSHVLPSIPPGKCRNSSHSWRSNSSSFQVCWFRNS